MWTANRQRGARLQVYYDGVKHREEDKILENMPQLIMLIYIL